RARQEAVLLEADAQARQQTVLAKARAEAAAELAAVIESNPAAAESLRLLLARDWMAMGQEMARAHGGSVLMVDPQSPASLLAALKGLQEKG
ncbi:MAG: paraslipin, partial [Synechococcus sp.]|nr:paraslipin [Synechococcus sp.]